MNFHQVPAFHPLDAIPPVIIAGLYIVASSLIREPSRRNFNAIMIGGAGAAYLGGAFGVWEFAFTEVVTFCTYKGLQSYRFIAIGWLFAVIFLGNLLSPLAHLWRQLPKLASRPDSVDLALRVGELSFH